MRAREFITESPKTVLLEYKREITAQRLGPALYKKFMAEPLRRQQAIIENIDDIMLHTSVDKLQKTVVDELLKKLERADPSPNKQYVQWLARTYTNPLSITRYFEDVVSTVARWLNKFYELSRRNRLKPEDRDINRYSSFEALVQQMAGYPDIEKEKKQVERGNAKEIYSDANVRVIQPLDEEAACYYGQGTQWCTASTESENYFNSYNSEGPLYILIPKKAKHTGEKYQLHFADGQYMNENDRPVALKQLITERFPGLEAVFLKLHPELTEHVLFAPDNVLSGLWKLIGERVKQLLENEFESWENEDYEYQQHKRENPNVSYAEYLKMRHGKHYVYMEQKMLDIVAHVMRASANDIRDYSEQASRETGDSIHVTQLPSEFLNAMESEGIIPDSILDDLRRKQMAVYNVNSEIYKDIIDIRRFYKIGSVDNYVFGELGGLKPRK